MPRYVDAEEAKKNVSNILHREYETPEEDMALGAIDETPTVDVEPIVHAHWIRHERAEEVEGRLIPNYECSHCHGWFRDNRRRCGECGAKMDEKEG